MTYHGAPIKATYVHPPIPVRDRDWCACIDGDEEIGPYGWGATSRAAELNLIDQLDEQ